MNKYFVVVNLFFFTATSMFAQEQYKPTFLKLENEWLTAWKNKNLKELDKLTSNDLLLTSSLSKGEVLNKADCLKAIKERDCIAFQIDSIKVQLLQNTAVVVVWSNIKATVDNSNWGGRFLNTDVWHKYVSGWKLASRHSTWLDKVQ